MKSKLFLSVIVITQLLLISAWGADAPLVISVWPGVAPGSEGKTSDESVRIAEGEGEHVVANVHRPSLTVYLPPADKATGAAVVICPGGGHKELWMDHEGYNVAQWLAAHGIAGIILKYRLAQEKGSPYKLEIHSLADLQRSIQVVRSHANEWGIDSARVGVIGFSAGGELAALGSQRTLAAKPGNADVVERQDSKPAFQALIYPGNAKSIAPTKDSPPAFLACGYDDRPDIAEGITSVYLRFREAGVPAELHIYTGVGHGFGIRASNHTPSSTWPDRFREWLGDRGFLGRKP
jgi:endo-1,4-beta-xylanase